MTECTMCAFVQNLYAQFVRYCNVALQPAVLLAVRLLWGFSFYKTGRAKLENHGNIVEFFASLGIPAPELNAWFVGGLECFGGILLMVGLLSRPVAFMMTINMVVAYVTAHNAELLGIFSDRDAFAGATPFAYLLTSLLVLAFGPGPVSIDAVIRTFYGKKKDSGCSSS